MWFQKQRGLQNLVGGYAVSGGGCVFEAGRETNLVGGEIKGVDIEVVWEDLSVGGSGEDGDVVPF